MDIQQSSATVTDVAETAPRKDPAAATAGQTRLEDWFQGHTHAIGLAVLAAGFALRLYVASLSFLDPDEAIHYLLVHQHSLFQAYKTSLTNAHPPLIYVILYFWQFLGRSELILRLPSVLAGTAACWFLYKWVAKLFGSAAGLCALILAAFSPSLISLSAEVREYAVMLVCMAGALYFLERAFETQSRREIVYFSVWLYLAILSHYSVAFFAVGVGIYALARILHGGISRRVAIAWAAGQLGALGVYAFLYLTHVSKIKPSEMQLWAGSHELGFFHRGLESLFGFTLRQTLTVFNFLFLAKYLDVALFAAFFVAVIWLLGSAALPQRWDLRGWPVGLLFILPFAAVWVAGLAHVYPYAGSRHVVYLAPFVLGAIGFLTAKLTKEKLWLVVSVAAVIVFAENAWGVRYEPYLSDANLARAEMQGALTYVRSAVPRSDRVFVDMQSDMLLAYYLCPKDYVPIDPYGPDFLSFSCDGYSVIATTDRVWRFVPETFVPQFEAAAQIYHLNPGQRVWIFQAGWGADLDTQLLQRAPKYRCLVSTYFGPNITVIPFVVGSDYSPDLPPIPPDVAKQYGCSAGSAPPDGGVFSR